MPSILTLDGARLGAIAIPLRMRQAQLQLRDVVTVTPPAVSNIMTSRIRAAQAAASNFRGFGGAISTGLGELSTGTRNTLIALGTIGLIAVVAHGGFRRAARRRRRGR